MSEAAWAFMLTIWAVIIATTAYCFWKLLTSERRLDGDEEMGGGAGLGERFEGVGRADGAGGVVEGLAGLVGVGDVGAGVEGGDVGA